MNKLLLIALFGLVLAIGLALSFDDDENNEARGDLESEFYWNGEEEDGDDEEPKEERETINGYSVEEKHDKPLSGPMQKSADPILPFIGLRLLRRAFRRRRRRRRRRFG
ncbi:unnamed protein product [Pocillopora meandrina]|uniref:Uncharacterized protein n=1 Tax=Pocillopora meandrina TaxID=46732 RepID=A0AAU9WSL6_9CNID|nr:unnamed protein product [Pocillopora meandrina]